MRIRLTAPHLRAALIGIAVIVCFATTNWSDKAPMSWTSLSDTISQLFHPDWSYVYDGSGEDLVSLMLQTICIAFLSMVIATVIAFPWSFINATTLWRHTPAVAGAAKFVTDLLRAFPELVYAIIFVMVVGPGPAAGVLALGVHMVGMLGKLYAENIESMDNGPAEAMESVGANFWKTTFFGRIPLLMPIFASLSLNHFEIAVRSAATLGLVGAGGIGAPLIFAIQSRQWSRVSTSCWASSSWSRSSTRRPDGYARNSSKRPATGPRSQSSPPATCTASYPTPSRTCPATRPPRTPTRPAYSPHTPPSG